MVFDIGKMKSRRMSAGLSVEQLALMAGLTRQGLWIIESGKSTPTLTSICRLADALGCEVADLLSEPQATE
jgi:transcriptional regulator with XRE-family HTH domain